MDFITKLPLSKDTTTGLEYKTVLTVAGRLTKWADFLPFKETWSATQLADVISRSVASTHGVLAGAHEAPRNEEQAFISIPPSDGRTDGTTQPNRAAARLVVHPLPAERLGDAVASNTFSFRGRQARTQPTFPTSVQTCTLPRFPIPGRDGGFEPSPLFDTTALPGQRLRRFPTFDGWFLTAKCGAVTDQPDLS